jgi:hypothetical protein
VNTKVQFLVLKNLILFPILSQINPVNATPVYFSFNILTPTSSSFLKLFHQNPVYIALVPMSATSLAYLILFDFVILIICGKEYKLLNSLLSQQTPITSFLLAPSVRRTLFPLSQHRQEEEISNLLAVHREAIFLPLTALVLRADSPPTQSRRSIGSGGESSSMPTSVAGVVQSG